MPDQKLFDGARVTVHNLVAAAHLNGRQGTVLRYNNKRKRNTTTTLANLMLSRISLP